MCRLLAGMNQSEIAVLIQNAATELTRFFACPQGLTQYIKNSLPLIISRIFKLSHINPLFPPYNERCYANRKNGNSTADVYFRSEDF